MVLKGVNGRSFCVIGVISYDLCDSMLGKGEEVKHTDCNVPPFYGAPMTKLSLDPRNMAA